ncbi:hypothetical protein WJ970_28175 [Achromobacter xylosoxidans]
MLGRFAIDMDVLALDWPRSDGARVSKSWSQNQVTPSRNNRNSTAQKVSRFTVMGTSKEREDS